jgi:hypothetical protein
MLGVAGFAGYMTLLFAAIALWWALANVMDQGWAALIVAAIWAAIGVVLYVVGRRRLRQIHPTPQRTAETVKELPGTLKESVRRKHDQRTRPDPRRDPPNPAGAERRRGRGQLLAATGEDPSPVTIGAGCAH